MVSRNLSPVWYYTSPGKEEYSARLFRSEVGRSLKKKKNKKKKKTKTKKKKKPGETAILIKAVYEMIDKRAISPVTSLEVYSYSLFLGVSEEEMTVSILKVR